MDTQTIQNNTNNSANVSPFPYVSEMACFAVLWLQTIGSDSIKQRLIDELMERNDIHDARYTTSGPLRLVIKYDGMMTVPSRIQKLVNRTGVRALIVGC